ncbi:MAG: YjjG family noncanonical pyrimidine nucleotidase [Mobilitalea sp.]
MNQFKTILLDADDTIFDFDACAREAIVTAFSNHKYPLDEQIYASYKIINTDLWNQFEQGKITRETVIYSRFGLLFKQMGIEDDGIAFEDEFQELLGMQHFMIPEAEQIVKYLYEKYDLYIVTNGVTATQLRRFRESGIDQYMKRIFVSEETGYQKPMKEYFDYCFDRIDCFEADKTMIIGDSLSSDMKGGNNAGIVTCWYNPNLQVRNPDIKIDYEISDIKELYRLL